MLVSKDETKTKTLYLLILTLSDQNIYDLSYPELIVMRVMACKILLLTDCVLVLAIAFIESFILISF